MPISSREATSGIVYAAMATLYGFNSPPRSRPWRSILRGWAAMKAAVPGTNVFSDTGMKRFCHRRTLFGGAGGR